MGRSITWERIAHLIVEAPASPSHAEPPAGTTSAPTPGDGRYHLSATDARDPLLYRQAKARAAEAGQALVIDPAAPEPPSSTPAPAEPGTVVVRKDAMQDPAAYRAAKADAAQHGKRLVIIG